MHDRLPSLLCDGETTSAAGTFSRPNHVKSQCSVAGDTANFDRSRRIFWCWVLSKHRSKVK